MYSKCTDFSHTVQLLLCEFLSEAGCCENSKPAAGICIKPGEQTTPQVLVSAAVKALSRLKMFAESRALLTVTMQEMSPFQRQRTDQSDSA